MGSSQDADDIYDDIMGFQGCTLTVNITYETVPAAQVLYAKSPQTTSLLSQRSQLENWAGLVDGHHIDDPREPNLNVLKGST